MLAIETVLDPTREQSSKPNSLNISGDVDVVRAVLLWQQGLGIGASALVAPLRLLVQSPSEGIHLSAHVNSRTRATAY